MRRIIYGIPTTFKSLVKVIIFQKFIPPLCGGIFSRATETG
jgi:hypothetical protein